jgi:PleD family two-component response regulator
MVTDNPELLVGLSDDELEALADSLLAPSAQARLDELLSRNTENRLTTEELSELDHLVARVDQLTILKTRAKYTLRQQAGATGA